MYPGSVLEADNFGWEPPELPRRTNVAIVQIRELQVKSTSKNLILN